jgi:hypothetical protein
LQGVQWTVGLVVVRASWPGHPRKSKKKKKETLLLISHHPICTYKINFFTTLKYYTKLL